MEFGANKDFYEMNTFACQCLNEDTYLAQPYQKFFAQGKLDDRNGKACGVVPECLDAAIQQQHDLWDYDRERAAMDKDQAREDAKQTFVSDKDVNKAR